MKVRSDIVLQASGRAGTANAGQNRAGRHIDRLVPAEKPADTNGEAPDLLRIMGTHIINKILTGADHAQCETCGEDDFSPNIEAWEISGQIVCDECAEEIFEANGQFGVGS